MDDSLACLRSSRSRCGAIGRLEAADPAANSNEYEQHAIDRGPAAQRGKAAVPDESASTFRAVRGRPAKSLRSLSPNAPCQRRPQAISIQRFS